jgi:fructosamine-3-kinase
MEFKEYSLKNNCKLFHETEQSKIFLTEDNRVCKFYFNKSDKNAEASFYNMFESNKLINLPKLYLEGENFIEIELLKNEKKFDLERTINEVSKLYIGTKNIQKQVKNINLSKEKLYYRINYLKEEIRNKDISPNILEKCKLFVNKKYNLDADKCIVHGDLKSAHIFNTSEGIKFIDFALCGFANPWYDLAFLCMEEQDNKQKIFDQIVNLSYSNLGEVWKLNKTDISTQLQSSIFHRTLYLFGFALRHRPRKSIERIIKELEDIIQI